MWRWPLYSEEFYRQILEDGLSGDQMGDYLRDGAGHGLFGPFVDEESPADYDLVLSVLKKALAIRAVAQACEARPGGALDYDGAIASNEGMFAAERDAASSIESLGPALKDDARIRVSAGTGYEGSSGTDGLFPQAHLIHFEMDLSAAYAEWLRPRVQMYNGLGSAAIANVQMFLTVVSQVELLEDAANRKLVVDVYGRVRTMTSWADRLDYYSEELAGDSLGSLELFVGLGHLSDALASVHLMTAVGLVSSGNYVHACAADALTELWYHAYAGNGEKKLIAGFCEVCHRLFVTANGAKRGHDTCMNKQRAKRSKARKFARLVEDGTGAKQAAKEASISAATAINLLRDEGYEFVAGVNYGAEV